MSFSCSQIALRLARPTMLLLASFVLSSGFHVTPCAAEQWSLSGEHEHPPARAENRIIKWCEDGSERVRWASANIKLKGYQPCGKLTTISTCDAGGQRLIANDEAARPNDHRDCGVGPRILILNHGEDDTVDTSNLAENPEDVTPLSSKEQQDLKREFKQAKKLQKNDPMMQMQQMADMFLQQLLSGPGGNKKSERELDTMLKNVDPKTRRAIKQLLKQYGP